MACEPPTAAAGVILPWQGRWLKTTTHRHSRESENPTSRLVCAELINVQVSTIYRRLMPMMASSIADIRERTTKRYSLGVARMHSTARLASFVILGLLAGCVTSSVQHQVSGRGIIGPAGYSVDWDVPETGTYWLPRETETETKNASEICKAGISVFVYHHIPRPPQFSYIGFRFEETADDAARSCLVARLKAVPSLTIYPKRR